MSVHTLRRRRPADALTGWLFRGTLGAGLLGPLFAGPPVSLGAGLPLTAVLQTGQTETLSLTWTVGREGEAAHLLRIEGGRATLQSCAPPRAPTDLPSCVAVGSPLMLTPGQRGQLGSVLRAADLGHLRSADPESRAAADRSLSLTVPGEAAGAQASGRWQLARSEWPAPPDGYGLAGFLDELTQKLRQTAQVRQPVAIPTTGAELAALRLQLRLTPRSRPGGLLVIEHGRIQVTPAEGSLPRSPLPHAWERPLEKREEEQLVKALQAAQLDQLDQRVQKRSAPAIGDTDGRLATFHLRPAMPAEPAVATNPPGKSSSTPALIQAPKEASAPHPAGALRVEPRGVERYLADLMRSPAEPLLSQLVELLLAPPPAEAQRPRARAR